jgi:hypothetical protein
MARRTIIVIDDFYRDPYAVRHYAGFVYFLDVLPHLVQP